VNRPHSRSVPVRSATEACGLLVDLPAFKAGGTGGAGSGGFDSRPPSRSGGAVVGVRLILTTDFFTPVVDDAYD